MGRNDKREGDGLRIVSEGRTFFVMYQIGQPEWKQQYTKKKKKA